MWHPPQWAPINSQIALKTAGARTNSNDLPRFHSARVSGGHVTGGEGIPAWNASVALSENPDISGARGASEPSFVSQAVACTKNVNLALSHDGRVGSSLSAVLHARGDNAEEARMYEERVGRIPTYRGAPVASTTGVLPQAAATSLYTSPRTVYGPQHARGVAPRERTVTFAPEPRAAAGPQRPPVETFPQPSSAAPGSFAARGVAADTGSASSMKNVYLRRKGDSVGDIGFGVSDSAFNLGPSIDYYPNHQHFSVPTQHVAPASFGHTAARAPANVSAADGLTLNPENNPATVLGAAAIGPRGHTEWTRHNPQFLTLPGMPVRYDAGASALAARQAGSSHVPGGAVTAQPRINPNVVRNRNAGVVSGLTRYQPLYTARTGK